ncbi:hypothetical protein MAR_021881 [Mya arenaria]|uniref:Uncharacterized protein n=1 Tax=Mya arenaria TaxID=6604 RepID=A0ABY7EC41_MYAAR|nr:hypothetical protein MAR_021881 [Mya arenaria]
MIRAIIKALLMMSFIAIVVDCLPLDASGDVIMMRAKRDLQARELNDVVVSSKITCKFYFVSK